MKLLIIGGTGTLGRQIARHALDEGYDVFCLVRNPRKASFLKEWGADLIQGDLCQPTSLKSALQGIDAVIDASTARATDTLSVRDVDWEGKVALIQAAEAAKVERFIFLSIMNAQDYPHVPLMDIKACTESFLEETDLNYTILSPCGFFQGLIGQYAIPVLDEKAVWVMGEGAPIAYMDTQDIAKFAVKALTQPNLSRQRFHLSGPKTWGPSDIVKLCERLSGKEAKIFTMPVGVVRAAQKATRFFEWGYNAADRLAFTEVIAASQPLTTTMNDVYEAFGLDSSDISTLESYMQDYYGRILKKLKELDYEKNQKKSRKRTPFKSRT